MTTGASRIHFGDRDWNGVAQDQWLIKAANPNHPPELRVYFAALGRRRVGGHAPFDRGELAELLVNKHGVIPDRRRVAEAIQKCVHWGYLAPGSDASCLVVPPDHVQGGRGHEYRCRHKHSVRVAQPHHDGCTCSRCSKTAIQ